MGAFQRKYTDDQLAAIVHAGIDAAPRVAAKDIVRFAQQGVLTGPDGRDLEPFDLKLSTVRTYLQREKRRRRAALPKGSRDLSDPALRREAAIREAWTIVERDVKIVGRAKIYDEHGKVIGENVGKKHRALGEILKNVGTLEKMAEPKQPPVGSDAPKAAEPADPTAELTRAARTEPPKLAEARAPVALPDRLAGRGPLPPVRPLRAE